MAKASENSKVKTKKTTTKTATAAKAKGSSRVEKKVAKALKKAVKSASKIKVRGGEEKKTKTKNEGSRKKFHAVGHAPQSARISAYRGEMRAVRKTALAPAENEERVWLLIDASNQTVGRLASEVSMLLRGKHKPTFTAHSDAGDFVVIINAEKVKFKGAKEEEKRYYKHSGWIGGMKITSPAKLRADNHPERILESAVKGMISRTPLGRDLMKKLKIYQGAEHPHQAQNPIVWQLRHSAQNYK